MTEDHQEEATNRSETRRKALLELHHRTHEVELIISLAVVFGLFQLPEPLDLLFEQYGSGLSQGGRFTAFLLYYLASLFNILLATVFLVHLASRAVWIALVGLHSVYPEGIDWDNLPSTSVPRYFLQPRVPNFAKLIEQVDDFCSSLFSFCFPWLVVFTTYLMMAMVMGIIAFGIHWLQGGEGLPFPLWAGLYMGTLALPPMAMLYARKLEKADRIETLSPRRRKILDGLMKLNFLLLGGSLMVSIQYIFLTRLKSRLLYNILILALVAGVFGTFIFRMTVRHGALERWTHSLYPTKGGALIVEERHYQSLRPPNDSYWRTPSLPAPIVEGDWLELYLPLSNNWQEDAFTLCRGTPWQEGKEDSVHQEKWRDCLSHLWTVSLDGATLPRDDWNFQKHPHSGVPSLVARIAIHDLPSGRHLLRVESLPIPKTKPFPEGAGPPWSPPNSRDLHWIPFWK